jgi:hypothetical protein
MTRWFNTAGPCQPEMHYTVPSLPRIPQIESLIAQAGYFVLHAPRQVGKTTAILTIAEELTVRGKYTAVMVSAEVGAAFKDRPGAAQAELLRAWDEAVRFWLPAELQPPDWLHCETIGQALSLWCRHTTRPIVLFIDEIDALQDEALIAVLRQLRDGYPRRPKGFPHSLALVGLRDVRDYKVVTGSQERLGTASPFNIKVESLTLENFSLADVTNLYGQHTAETGQVFTSEAISRAYELTQGQPWLVNALARQMVEVLVPDRTIALTIEHVDAAKELLIRRQDTHLDSLAERLREPRVRSIIEPMMAGQELVDISNDDVQFILDLGLCKMGEEGGLVIANPIYREVLPRVLTMVPMAAMAQISPRWLRLDGVLDLDILLQSFLDFWRQHGEPLLNSAAYHEIAPHIVLMAFLHRVINGSTSSPTGGGSLEREYAIGSDRMDLYLRYGEVRLGIELKVWRDRRPDPLTAGLEQIDRYLARLNLDRGWLVIFDRRSTAADIANRTITEMAMTSSNRSIVVIRC